MAQPPAPDTDAALRDLSRYNLLHGHDRRARPLPDDPILLKHLLLLAGEQAAAKDARIEQLQEQVALLRHKLFSPKSERNPEDTDSPQLAMFNEAEELIEAGALRRRWTSAD
ncbi:MAG: hypothetical protein B7X51_05310 [Pseudomonas sp. 34-62-33]|nr:MAG: hypothetical protein B7X51_05310 [Pseudomonas sp. 34-62-33]